MCYLVCYYLSQLITNLQNSEKIHDIHEKLSHQLHRTPDFDQNWVMFLQGDLHRFRTGLMP